MVVCCLVFVGLWFVVHGLGLVAAVESGKFLFESFLLFVVCCGLKGMHGLMFQVGSGEWKVRSLEFGVRGLGFGVSGGSGKWRVESSVRKLSVVCCLLFVVCCLLFVVFKSYQLFYIAFFIIQIYL